MKLRNKRSNVIKKHLGLSYEQVTSICRSCLATERKVFSIKVFESVFQDLTGIVISPSDGLPQVLCYECVALFNKFVKFRKKVLKSHEILTEYALDKTFVAPNNLEGPLLVQTNVMYYEIPETDENQLGLHIDSVEGGIDFDETKEEDVEVKDEDMFSDNEADWCVEDPLNEMIDRESNDTKRSGSICDMYPEESRGDAEVQYLEFDVAAEDTPQLLQDIIAEDSDDIVPKQEIDIEIEEETKLHTDEIKTEVTADKEINKINELLTNFNKVHCKTNRVKNVKRRIDSKNNNKECVEKSYSCGKCKKCFRTKKYYKLHINGNTARPYNCDECCKRFSNKYTLFRHSLVHIAKPFQCDICSKSYKHKISLISHLNEHFSNSKTYMCDSCGKTFYTVSALHQHIRRHVTEIEMKCEVCKASFPSETELKRHVGLHTGQKPFKCHLCIKCYKNPAELERHIRIKHDIYFPFVKTGKPYECSFCNKCYAEESSLKVHLRNHNRPYQCDVCSLGYCNKKSLIKHLDVHFSEKLHKCIVCKRSYRSERHLRDHMYKHSDYKFYKCNVCEESFYRTIELTRHIREYHTEDKPYKCDVCMKRFQTSSQIQRHSIVHTGEKPNKCEICKRSFFSKQYLEIHMRKHTGEKPFKCEVCTKTFTAKTYLALHMRRHTGEKPHKCDVCMKCFSQRTSLKMHYRLHEKTDKIEKSKPCKSFEDNYKVT